MILPYLDESLEYRLLDFTEPRGLLKYREIKISPSTQYPGYWDFTIWKYDEGKGPGDFIQSRKPIKFHGLTDWILPHFDIHHGSLSFKIFQERDEEEPAVPCVYVIESGNSGYFKIGKSGPNPYMRLDTLQTGNPERLTFRSVIYTPNNAKLESQLHRKFASKKIRSEWFALSDADLEYIETLKEEI